MLSSQLTNLLVSNAVYKLFGFLLLLMLPLFMEEADFVRYTVLMSYIMLFAPILSLQFVNLYALKFYDKAISLETYVGSLFIGTLPLIVLFFFLLKSSYFDVLSSEIAFIWILIGGAILSTSNLSITRMRLFENWRMYFILSVIFGFVPVVISVIFYFSLGQVPFEIVLLSHFLSWSLALTVLPSNVVYFRFMKSFEIFKSNFPLIGGFFLQDVSVFVFGAFGRTAASQFVSAESATIFTLMLSIAAMCVFVIDLVFESFRKDILTGKDHCKVFLSIFSFVFLFISSIYVSFSFFINEILSYVYKFNYELGGFDIFSFVFFVFCNSFFIFSKWISMKKGNIGYIMIFHVIFGVVGWFVLFSSSTLIAFTSNGGIGMFFLVPAISMLISTSVSFLFQFISKKISTHKSVSVRSIF